MGVALTVAPSYSAMMQASRWVGGATLNQSSHYSDTDKLWNGGRGERGREERERGQLVASNLINRVFAKKISFICEH